MRAQVTELCEHKTSIHAPCFSFLHYCLIITQWSSLCNSGPRTFFCKYKLTFTQVTGALVGQLYTILQKRKPFKQEYKRTRYEGTWGKCSVVTLRLDLGTRWRWVVNFMSQPVYPWKKIPCNRLNRRLAGPQRRFGWFVELKNLFFSRDNSCHPAHSLVNITTELYWPRTSKALLNLMILSWFF
jgi:hypothetical protein